MTPRLTKGHPTGWPVYLDFGAVDWPDPWANWVHEWAWGLTANAGLDVLVTTVLPKTRPAFFTWVVFRPERLIPWEPAIAGTTQTVALRNGRASLHNVVEACTTGHPRLDAIVAAHEVVHCLSPVGMGHEPAGNNLMSSPPSFGPDMAPQLTPRRRKAVNATVADLLAGWREDYRHHTDGVIRFERFNIKTGATT